MALRSYLGRKAGEHGWRVLERGEVLSFPTGEEGAHQVRRRRDARLPSGLDRRGTAYLHLPRCGKIGAFEGAPNGSGVREYYRREDEVGHWARVEPPGGTS